jgi:hypothetical protein
MTGDAGQPDGAAEVSGLAAEIADRILEQHAAGIAIPPEQFVTLVTAARMLLSNGVPWPPSVEQVVMEVAKRAEEAKAASAGTDARSEGDDVVMHLTQFLGAVKRHEGGSE